MNKKFCLFFICLSLCLCVSSGMICAMTELSVNNTITTGIVDIELEEYSIKDGKETVWIDQSGLMPGDHISKIPRIVNHGSDCYVRASVDFETAPIGMDQIYGLGDLWIKGQDGYFYYTAIVPTGEHVDLFEGVMLPEDLSETYSDTSFRINISAEAIQSSHLTPDYDRESPWGDVEILACEKEGMYDMAAFRSKGTHLFRVYFDKNTEKLAKNSDDFFANIPVLYPGDTYTDQFEISNESSKKIHLYFRTNVKSDSELLDQMTLKIICFEDSDQRTIYEGRLSSPELRENILLASMQGNTSGIVQYTVTMPEKLNNTYTLQEDAVQWYFSTKPIDEKEIVKTGDDSLKMAYILGILGIISAGIAFMIDKKTKVRNVSAKKH